MKASRIRHTETPVAKCCKQSISFKNSQKNTGARVMLTTPHYSGKQGGAPPPRAKSKRTRKAGLCWQAGLWIRIRMEGKNYSKLFIKYGHFYKVFKLYADPHWEGSCIRIRIEKNSYRYCRSGSANNECGSTALLTSLVIHIRPPSACQIQIKRTRKARLGYADKPSYSYMKAGFHMPIKKHTKGYADKPSYSNMRAGFPHVPNSKEHERQGLALLTSLGFPHVPM